MECLYIDEISIVVRLLNFPSARGSFALPEILAPAGEFTLAKTGEWLRALVEVDYFRD